MYKQVIVTLVLVVYGIYSYAQNSNKNYIEMRNEGISHMKKGEFSVADKKFKGANGFVENTYEESEITRLRKQLSDSIYKAFNRGVGLAQNAKSIKEYSSAVEELKKLIPTDNLNVSQVYRWLGYCYEHLNEPFAAIDYYNEGVKHNEACSAIMLTSLLKKYKNVSDDSIRHLYNIAYRCYKQSGTNEDKYQMATLLITNKVSSNEDPINILQQLSDNNYADAQFYLGLLFFHGEKVTKDESKGLRLINLAKENGCDNAKRWLLERNEELKKRNYIYR